MAVYLLRRLVGLVVVLLAMTFIVFCLQSVVPGDPARAIAGPAAPAEALEVLRERLGLHDPMAEQYGRYLRQLAQGDLGISVRTRQPVNADVRKYLPASIELGAMGLTLAAILGCLFALGQNLWRRSTLLRLALILAGSTPIFLSALVLIYVVWFRLDWLPGAGRLSIRGFVGPTGINVLDGLLAGRPDISIDALRHLVLPALVLAFPAAVAIGRSLSASLHDAMRQPYIRTMQGKGLDRPELLLRHGLRNAAIAPLSMMGLQVGLLLGNLMIVERIFAWPGLGLYMVQSLASADLPAVLGVSLVFGGIYILCNAAIDIAQALADPRVGVTGQDPRQAG